MININYVVKHNATNEFVKDADDNIIALFDNFLDVPTFMRNDSENYTVYETFIRGETHAN